MVIKKKKSKRFKCAYAKYNKDCVSVLEAGGTCRVCKRIYRREVIVTSESSDPHLVAMYRDALIQFEQEYSARFNYTSMPTIDVELTDTKLTYNTSYLTGQEYLWTYTFKITRG